MGLVERSAMTVIKTKQNFFRWPGTGSKTVLVFTVQGLISMITKEELLAYSMVSRGKLY